MACDRGAKSAALSFGALEVSDAWSSSRRCACENLSRREKLFTVTPSFRYANDQASGAVRWTRAARCACRARGSEELEVKLIIDPAKLPDWTLNGGSQGGNGAGLNGPEYDGYITLTAGSEKISVPWHVLPRKAAQTEAFADRTRQSRLWRLRNRGASDSEYDVFSLAGVSRQNPAQRLARPG